MQLHDDNRFHRAMGAMHLFNLIKTALKRTMVISTGARFKLRSS